jgi:endonuclease/exonuclease/phosphatase family metal-dependent hydrolase
MQKMMFVMAAVGSILVSIPAWAETSSAALSAAILASRSEPCFGIPADQKNPRSCAAGMDLVGQGSAYGSCCVARALSEQELKGALTQSRMDFRLAERVRSVLDTVLVRNLREEARGTEREAAPSELKVMEYNAARGEFASTLIPLLTDCQEFMRAKLDPSKTKKLSAEARARLERQACRATSADLILFNELDYFMCRSGYQDVTWEIASRLGMNYSFSPEFLEIDSRQLGLKKNEEMPQCSKPDFTRARQIHGNAILSRFPIRSARRLELTPCYDWYESEKNKGLAGLFKKSASQVRRGGRNAMIAEIELPQGTVTVVSAHLENKTDGYCRARQMNEVLAAVRGVTGPIILGGDLNTTGVNGNTGAAVGDAIAGGGSWSDILGNAVGNSVTDESPVFAAVRGEGFDLSPNDGKKTFIGKGGHLLQRLDYLGLRAPSRAGAFSCVRTVRGETLDLVGEFGLKASDHLPIMMDVQLSCGG